MQVICQGRKSSREANTAPQPAIVFQSDDECANKNFASFVNRGNFTNYDEGERFKVGGELSLTMLSFLVSVCVPQTPLSGPEG